MPARRKSYPDRIDELEQTVREMRAALRGITERQAAIRSPQDLFWAVTGSQSPGDYPDSFSGAGNLPIIPVDRTFDAAATGAEEPTDTPLRDRPTANANAPSYKAADSKVLVFRDRTQKLHHVIDFATPLHVRNDTAGSQLEFAVYLVGEPLTTPGVDLVTFQTRIAFSGLTPPDPVPEHPDIAIATVALEVGETGTANYFGLSPCRIYVADEDAEAHKWAKFEPENNFNLVTTDDPCEAQVKIVWKEPGYGSVVWSIVRW